MKMKSVQSIHLCKSVIQTTYDIVKAHGGELKVETVYMEGLPADLSILNEVKADASAQAGSLLFSCLSTELLKITESRFVIFYKNGI